MLSAVSLQIAPISAAAQANALTLRALVESQCGEELAAYEETVPAGQSIWRREADRTLDASRQSMNVVGAWLGSGYPLIDGLVPAGSTLRPERRSEVASQLGRALALTNCLRPSTAQLAVYSEDGPSDAAEVIKGLECTIDLATTVHAAMLSDMGAPELSALAKEQITAPDCEGSR